MIRKISLMIPVAIAVLALNAGVLQSIDTAEAAKADKQFVCHQTASAKNPFVVIHISANAVGDDESKHLGKHNQHSGNSDAVGEECLLPIGSED